jgi:hypothetical protein
MEKELTMEQIDKINELAKPVSIYLTEIGIGPYIKVEITDSDISTYVWESTRLYGEG